jgi:hypothetical protein
MYAFAVMTVTTPGAEGDSPQTDTGLAGGSAADAPTDSLLGTQVGSDRCAVCGAGLSPDQRYCVECGTRRGKPRFSVQAPTRQEPADVPVAATKRRGLSSGGTLLAGIATLLLALGVGVLIGHSNSSSPKNGNVRVVVNGGGGSGGSTGAAAATTSSTGSSGSSGSTAHSSHAKAKVTAAAHVKAKKAAAPPASSGVSKSVQSSPTVKPGGSCTAGTPGCQNGKETGNFFPGG